MRRSQLTVSRPATSATTLTPTQQPENRDTWMAYNVCSMISAALRGTKYGMMIATRVASLTNGSVDDL